MTAPFILAEAPVLVLALHSACHFILHTLTHTRTGTHKSNPPELCFSKAPATAHEICLYHLVAVKVLVWTTVSALDPTEKNRENKGLVMLCVHLFISSSFFITILSHASAPLIFSVLAFYLVQPISALLNILLSFSPLPFPLLSSSSSSFSP